VIPLQARTRLAALAALLGVLAAHAGTAPGAASSAAEGVRSADPTPRTNRTGGDEYGVRSEDSTPRLAALPAPTVVSIPLRDPGSGQATMVAEVFRPEGAGPFPVVVFSHGRAPSRAARDALRHGASEAQLRYWLARGAAVVAPIRPGYGATGGADAEASGSRIDAQGRCVGKPDFRKTAEAGSAAILAAVGWLRGEPWADARLVLLVGQSVGGLATVAAAAQHPAGVVGYVNFAGGTGGNPEHSPGRSCDPEQLTRLYAAYGRATTVPNLWIYAENDQYWGGNQPAAWHAAFAQGSGSRTTFVRVPAVPDGDGHGLSRHEARLWARPVDGFVAGIGFATR